MGFRVIKSEDIKIDDLEVLEAQRLLNDESSEVSFAKIKIKGKTKWSYNKKSDIYYYILEGNGIFHFENEDVPVKKGDLVVVPKNTKYRDEGNQTMLAIAKPRFNPENTVYVDEK